MTIFFKGMTDSNECGVEDEKQEDFHSDHPLLLNLNAIKPRKLPPMRLVPYYERRLIELLWLVFSRLPYAVPWSNAIIARTQRRRIKDFEESFSSTIKKLRDMTGTQMALLVSAACQTMKLRMASPASRSSRE